MSLSYLSLRNLLIKFNNGGNLTLPWDKYDFYDEKTNCHNSPYLKEMLC